MLFRLLLVLGLATSPPSMNLNNSSMLRISAPLAVGDEIGAVVVPLAVVALGSAVDAFCGCRRVPLRRRDGICMYLMPRFSRYCACLAMLTAFCVSCSSQAQNRHSSTQPNHDQAPSASDLLARFSTSSGNRSASNLQHSDDREVSQQSQAGISSLEPSAPVSHDNLVQQLGTSHASSTEPIRETDESHALAQEQEKVDMDETMNGQQPPTTQPPTGKPIFTYTNPFEALRASRPHTPRAPQSQAPQSQAQNIANQVLGQSAEVSQAAQGLNQLMADRVKLTPKSRASKPSAQLEKQLTRTKSVYRS